MGTFHGNDRAHDAQRFADGDAEDVGGEGDALALEFAAEAAVHLEDVGDGLGLDAAFGAQGLAGFEGDEAGELLGVAPSGGRRIGLTRAPRLREGILAQDFLRAVGVDATASSTSAASPSAARATSMPVAGLTTGEGLAGAGGHQAAADEVQAGQGGGQRLLVERDRFGGGVGTVQHGFAL